MPLAVAFIRKDDHGSQAGVSLALALGVLVSLAIVGAVTLAAGRIAGDLWGAGPWIGALILLCAGLYFLDVLSLPTSMGIDSSRIPRNGWGAVLIGLILGVTLGPCTFAFFAPVFAASFGSVEREPLFASGLVSAFALGHTLAIAVAGMLGLRVGAWLSKGVRLTSGLRSLAGLCLIVSAVYLIATAR